MAISFPSSPVAGTSIYQGGRQWTYDGTTWNLVLGGAYELYWTHTGTGGETTLSGASDNGTTLTYPLGGENVYLNGVLLVRGSDYTATTGSTIVLANPLAVSDILTVVSYPSVQMSSNNIAQTTEPTTYTPGMVWVNTAGNTQGLQLVRWKKTPNAGTTVLSGLADDGTTTLAYTAGYEEVYINGILIVKGVDYTATNGTSITLTQATVTGDTVEVFNTITMGVTNTYTQSQSDARYLQPAGVGNDGQVPVSSYGATGGYVWQNQQMAGKNAIIGGGFDIWQRGTSFATNTIAYTADRWQIWSTVVAANCTVTQVAGTNGAKYAAQFGRQSGVTTQPTPVFATTLETSESLRFAGQNVTVSFEAFTGANYSGGTLGIILYQGTGTDQNFTAFTGSTTQIISKTLSSTNTRYTATFAVPSGTTQLGLSFSYASTGTAGAADYVQIQKVQLELGSVATTFSRAGGTVQGELAACQRYYYRTNPVSSAYSRVASGRATSTTNLDIMVPLPVAMRTIPTSVDFASLMTTTANSISAVAITQPTTTTAVADCTSSGLTSGTFYQVMINNSTSGYLGFSAEL